jgi:hypothetical protein
VSNYRFFVPLWKILKYKESLTLARAGLMQRNLDIMKKCKNYFLFVIVLSLFGCLSITEIEKYGQHYQKHNDYDSLNKVVELMKLEVETSYVKTILGEPIDMGFDYRYLIDSVGPNGCSIGAVFHINDVGKIDQKWIDEICE